MPIPVPVMSRERRSNVCVLDLSEIGVAETLKNRVVEMPGIGHTIPFLVDETKNIFFNNADTMINQIRVFSRGLSPPRES